VETIFMRLADVRGRAGVRVLAVLLTALVLGGSVDWGHTGWDDPACDPVPVLHDHSAHRYGSRSEQSPPSDGHCYLCHALRLLHIALTAHPYAVAQASATTLSSVAALTSPSEIAAGSTLPRAPPAALV
jgi:hypothetical protein